MDEQVAENNCLNDAAILEFLASELPESDEQRICSHLKFCADCRRRVDELSDLPEFRQAFQTASASTCGDENNLVTFREKLYQLPPTGAFDREPQAVAAEAAPGKSLGRFELHEKLGAGGFGTVYLAYDTVLKRHVALKMPRFVELDDSDQMRVLEREGRAAASLHHVNIVQVLEVGLVDDVCYLASEYCSGQTLAQWLDPEQPAEPLLAAKIVLRLAEGAGHAHSQGIVHRDIKPGNVILDDRTRSGDLPFTPRLTDFGLARLADANQTATASGVLKGTPPYMAPEQVTGQTSELGPPTDVYALGAVLYELLTGAVPIEGRSSADTLRRIVSTEPTAPRRRVAAIPPDLEAICLKCLERSAARRYATGAELADDLRRFVNGQPTVARPIPPAERLWRWAKRHPAASIAATTLLVAAATVMTLVAVHNRQLEAAAARMSRLNTQLNKSLLASRRATARAVDSELVTRELLYAADIQLANRAREDGDVSQMQQILDRHVSWDGESDPRGVEWYLLRNSSRVSHVALAEHDGAIYMVSVSPDGKLLASTGVDGTVRVYSTASWQPKCAFHTGQGEVNGLAFTPDSRRLASAGDDGTIRIWDLESRQPVLKVQAHEKQAFQVVFDPSGKRLITCGVDSVIRVWDLETGQPSGTLTGHQRTVDAVAISHDGKLLGSISRDETVRIWNLTDGTTRREMALPTRPTSIAFSPSGEWFSVGMLSGVARQFRLNDQTEFDLRHLDGVNAVAFSQDGRWAANVDRGGVVRIWAADEIRPEGPEPRATVWRAHESRINSIAFSPDSRYFVTAGADSSVKIWDLPPQSFRRSINNQTMFRSMAAHPDGFIVTAHESEVVFWSPSTGAAVRKFHHDSGPLSAVGVSRDGQWMATGSSDGILHLQDAETGKLINVWEHPSRFEVQNLMFAHAQPLLVAKINWQLAVFKLPDLKLVGSLAADTYDALAVSPDGTLLAVARTPEDRIELLDLQTGQHVSLLTDDAGPLFCLCFSPDGQLVVSGGDDRIVRVFDVGSARELHRLQGHHNDVLSVGFSPDGRTLISASRDGTVIFWHVRTGRLLFRFDARASTRQGSAIVTQEGSFMWVREDDYVVTSYDLRPTP